MMPVCAVVIPARWKSKRFPGKVLAPLGGRPVLQWCIRSALAARVGPVVVATDDRRVAAAAQGWGAQAVLTSSRAASGTDRVYEALRRLGLRPRWVINFQGDEPLLGAGTVRGVARVLRRSGADVATAVFPIRNESRAADPNVVKAALGRGGRVLYFSRSPVPFGRDGARPARYEHVGIYAFSFAALKRFVALPPSPLERAEKLEQLRALEDGMTFYAAVVAPRAAAIDTPGDIKIAERFLRARRHS